MTSTIRRGAGGLTILESLWLIYDYFYALEPTSCPVNGCPVSAASYFLPIVVLALAVCLLVVGVLGIWGASVAYPGGAVFSSAAIVILGYTITVWSSYPYLAPPLYSDVVGIVISALALGLNLVAFGRKERLSEQANPMNLPVFG